MTNTNVRRWRRSRLAAIVLAADPSSHIAIVGKATNISFDGCQIDSKKQLALGTTIRIELVTKGESFYALRQIACSQVNGGMGIRFVQVSQGNREILARWIEELQIEHSQA